MESTIINTFLRSFFVSIICCLLNCYSLFAFTNERFHHLTVKDGLAHTDVTCMIQDHTGLMWLGTNGGLQSYDGYQFTTYDYYKNKKGIRKLHNRIARMDRWKNILWIGTESGLLKFDCNAQSYVPIKLEGKSADLITNPVSIVSVSSEDGQVWINNNRSLYVITSSSDSSCHTLINLSTLLSKDELGIVNSIAHYGTNTWVCTKDYIYQFKHDAGLIHLIATISKVDLNIHNYFINQILIANNYLFLQTSKGLYRWKIQENNEIDRKSIRFLSFSDLEYNDDDVTRNKFVIDKNGTYWGVCASGLVEILAPFRNPVLKLYQKETKNIYSLSSEFISSFYIDSFNNLWIGTWEKGLNYRSINPSSFGLIADNMSRSISLGDSFVTSLDKDSDGTLWILTQKGGLSHYDIDKGVLTHADFRNLKLNNRIFKKVLLDRTDENIIYIGTIEGLLAYNKRNGRTWWIIAGDKEAVVNININVSGISFDGAGNLWVATWNKGLYVLDKTTKGFKLKYHVDTKNSSCWRILSERISKIYYDEHKNEMFLCTNRGMNRVLLDAECRIKKIIKYQADERKRASLSNNFIAAMDKQNDSIYWVGTLGGGLNRVLLKGESDNNYEAIVYDTSNGMSSNDIEIVLVDKDGAVWAGGNGIVKLDPMTGHTVKYDYIDGLQSNTFKFGSEYKGKDGMMYMGGTEGLNYFYPYQVQAFDEEMNLLLTGLDIHNSRIEVGQSYNGTVILPEILNQMDKLTLHHDQNNFTISYAIMGYQLSNRIMYRYRLKGFESEWQQVAVKRNKVSYSNLDYGKYVFELQASLDGGLKWSKQVKHLTIVVLPPWWLTSTAKMIYIIVVFALVFVLFYMYVHELKMKHQIYVRDIEKKKDEENHQMKLQFFMNISHEFKTPLTIILSAVERLTGTDDAQQSYYSSISRNANKLLALINELVDFRKTDLGIMSLRLSNGDIGIYVKDIVTEFLPWASKKEITINLDSIENIPMCFDMEMVTKIIYNVLSNSLKYTDEKGCVDVKVYKGKIESITPSFKYLHTEGCVSDSEVCVIVVKDTGIGISQDSISHIYDRFFQVESKTSTHLGSGIGLAVAKNMVLAHHGMIIVSSERNIGSEFIVMLPLGLAAENSNCQITGFDKDLYMCEQHIDYNYEDLPQKASQMNEELNGQEEERSTLLIVEDNKELLLTLEAQFANSYDVLLAENGEIGLELCRKKYPDVIISDVMMPLMDGIQMCAAIRNDLSVAYTPVILLTAKSSVENQIEGYETGADLYLPKPFSMRILELNVNRLIKHKRMTLLHNCEKTQRTEVKREDVLAEQDKVFVEQLNMIVSENMSNPDLSVELLCDKLGMGRTKLYATTKDLCGKPLGDYIRDTRLDYAAKLLRTTGMNVTEIIYETGFGSNSHFSKIFKMKYGMTPTEYIKNHDSIVSYKQLGSMPS